MQRIGLYGGSFNPIHFGHLIPALAAAELLSLDKLIFVPSANPPHKPAAAHLVAPEHRLEMVRRAIEGNPQFDVSDIELKRAGPSYTIDTIAELRRQYGLDVLLHWLIGADSLADLGLWHRAGELVDACRIVTMARPGWPVEKAIDRLRDKLTEDQVARLAGGVIATPLIEISATNIRHRIAAGKSVRYFLPGVVLHYIEQHALYRRVEGG
ncbi:MAG: nicotinate-nucleotide adenylyltransferase [Phycisphaerae bacterium]|nr:nicotinate-nucleotide adenylyltransferase [Phycisphaerae bacterium]